MANRHLLRALAAVCLVLTASPMLAQIPRTISFQGVLADDQGVLLPDGTYTVTVSVYEAATGGTAMFSESQQVQVSRGVFNAVIGSTTPAGIPTTVAFDTPYWLGVQIDNGAELAPRTPLTAVPYAMHAAHASVAIRSDSAGVAQRAVVADNAVHADTAHTVVGGHVASLNGRQGALEIVGAGATTVSVNGSQVVVRSASQSGGLQRIDNLDGTIVADPPQGPFVSLSIRSGAIQTQHLADASVTTSKLSTSGASTGSVLMSAGTTTPVWRHPVTASLPYAATLASPSALWNLTNTGPGWAGAFSGATNGVQVSGGAIALQIAGGRFVASIASVAGATTPAAAATIGGTSVIVDVTSNGAAGVPAHVRLPGGLDNGTILMVGTSDPDGAWVDGFMIGANQFATFVRIGGSWKVQL